MRLGGAGARRLKMENVAVVVFFCMGFLGFM